MTHHTDEELLPCPFCGAAPKIEGQGAVRWIKCPDDSACGSGGMAIGIPADDLARGIASWNRRAPAAPVPQGWKLVPTELLERVLDSETVNEMADASDELRAIVAAVPQPPEEAPKWDGAINPSDFTVDTFRRSGSGWLIKLDSCVRITHVPTGLFEEETADRSIHTNKAVAWERLCARLEALAAAPQPPEAAPVELPEYGIDTANHAGIRVRGYTEQQVRELLAAHGIGDPT